MRAYEADQDNQEIEFNLEISPSNGARMPVSAKHSRFNTDNSLTQLQESRKETAPTQGSKEQEKHLKCLVVPTQMVEGLSGTMGIISSV